MSDFYCESKDSGEPPCAGLVTLRAEIERLRSEEAIWTEANREAAKTLLALKADNDRLQGLVSVAYQLAGFYDAPVRFLDAFSGHEQYAAMNGEQIIDALLPLTADQPDAGPQAPIIRVSVDEFGSARVVKHYAPGLPFGEHELYCEPEATAPMMREEPDAAPKPKRAYHETHEPPHCPTCGCGATAQPPVRKHGLMIFNEFSCVACQSERTADNSSKVEK